MIVPTLALMFGSRHCFLFVFQPDNETLAAPNLNVVAVNQALRLGYSFAVVATNQRLKAYEVAVKANGINPVFRHPVYSKGRSSPVSSLETSGDRNGSSPSQSTHWNLRPPVFLSRKRMALRHFGQVGGGAFLGIGLSRWIRREHYPTHGHRLLPEDGSAIRHLNKRFLVRLSAPRLSSLYVQ